MAEMTPAIRSDILKNLALRLETPLRERDKAIEEARRNALRDWAAYGIQIKAIALLDDDSLSDLAMLVLIPDEPPAEQPKPRKRVRSIKE